jgi:C-terminal processing protease CtpA/Prc
MEEVTCLQQLQLPRSSLMIRNCLFTLRPENSPTGLQINRCREPLKSRVVVLTDEGSASASEILAGALQDWDRGIIIGRRTFGKGLVQNGFYLTDGSMIRFTIARYYTPCRKINTKRL